MPVDDPAVDARWDRAARHQTETERLDRNWSGLLQELPVVQTGVRLLTGFAADAVPFQPRFDVLDDGMRVVYLITVGCSVASHGGCWWRRPECIDCSSAGIDSTRWCPRHTAALTPDCCGWGRRSPESARSSSTRWQDVRRCHCGRRGIGGVRGVLARGAIADASGPTADYAVTEQYSGCAHVRCGARPICVRPR